MKRRTFLKGIGITGALNALPPPEAKAEEPPRYSVIYPKAQPYIDEVMRRIKQQQPSSRRPDHSRLSRWLVVCLSVYDTKEQWFSYVPLRSHIPMDKTRPVGWAEYYADQPDGTTVEADIGFVSFLDVDNGFKPLLPHIVSLELTGVVFVNCFDSIPVEVPRIVEEPPLMLSHRVARYPSLRQGGVTWGGFIWKTGNGFVSETVYETP